MSVTKSDLAAFGGPAAKTVPYTKGLRFGPAEEEAAGIFRPIPASAEIRHHYEMRHAPPQPTAAEFLEAVPARAAEPDSPPGSGPLLPTPVRAADETASREHVTADIERRVAAREDGPAASAPLPGQIWTPATLHRR